MQAAVDRSDYAPLIAELRARLGEGLRCVVLFGSRARGRGKAGSDHDLLVVADRLPSDPVRRRRVLAEALLPVLDRVPGPIGFVGKTTEELDRNLTALLLDAAIDGVCLEGNGFFEPYRKAAREALCRSGMRRERVGRAWMWVFPGSPPKDWELSWKGYRERA